MPATHDDSAGNGSRSVYMPTDSIKGTKTFTGTNTGIRGNNDGYER